MFQVALSGDGAYLVVHAPLSYSRQYNIPGNDNSGNVYTYKLVSSHCTQQERCHCTILLQWYVKTGSLQTTAMPGFFVVLSSAFCAEHSAELGCGSSASIPGLSQRSVCTSQDMRRLWRFIGTVRQWQDHDLNGRIQTAPSRRDEDHAGQLI